MDAPPLEGGGGGDTRGGPAAGRGVGRPPPAGVSHVPCGLARRVRRRIRVIRRPGAGSGGSEVASSGQGRRYCRAPQRDGDL